MSKDACQLESDGPWQQKVSSTLQQAKEAPAEGKSWKALHEESEGCDKAMSQLVSASSRGQRANCPQQAQQFEAAALDKRKQKAQCTEEPGCGGLNQLCRRSKALQEGINGCLASSKKPMGPAKCTLSHSIEAHGGAWC